jgi:hypothetical protein
VGSGLTVAAGRDIRAALDAKRPIIVEVDHRDHSRAGELGRPVVKPWRGPYIALREYQISLATWPVLAALLSDCLRESISGGFSRLDIRLGVAPTVAYQDRSFRRPAWALRFSTGHRVCPFTTGG